MKGKRSSHSKHDFLEAQAFWADRKAAECLISDISEAGARLQVADETDVTTFPERFTLVFANTGEQRFVRVAWRTTGELGVAFIGSL